MADAGRKAMELLQLQYFECIARHESVTRAAEELRISQPSLSGSVLRLEKELGMALFERKNRKMILTSYGEYFLSTTRRVLELINTSKLSFTSDMPDRISIGFQNYNEKILSLIEHFQQGFPQVEFNVYGSTLNAPFSTKSFSFIVGNSDLKLPFPTNKLLVETRSFYVALPKKHPLSDRKSLSMTELREDTFCFLREGHGNFEYAYQLCIENGFIPKCIFSTNNAFYKYRYVCNGSALGFFPTGWYPLLASQENISVIPLTGYDNFSNILLYWPQNFTLSPAEQAFLDYVSSALKSSFYKNILPSVI